MASAILRIPEVDWTKLENCGTSGSILHKEGDSIVAYTESAATPDRFGLGSPVMQQTVKGDVFPYFGVPAGQFVWAIALNDSAVITLTPSGA